MTDTAGIAEIKKELQNLPPKALRDLCLRLAKYKKENKELLSYLLFDSGNEELFVHNIKAQLDEAFGALKQNSLYLQKKSIRKTLRTTTKYIRYSGQKQTEVELLLYFCTKMKSSGIALRQNTVLRNLYLSQLKKIDKALATLHEDLQYDYSGQREAVEL